MDEDTSRQIVRRLDVIINLLLEGEEAKAPSTVASKVHRLTAIGLSQAQVGEILGKSSSYISAVLSKGTAKGGRRRA